AHEPVEILETHADRPLIEWASGAVEIGRSVMVLAKPRCGITVLSENRSDCGALRADNGVVTREASGHFADDAEADSVVVAARDQRRPRRRTKRRGVE